jgi:hypothetical protein
VEKSISIDIEIYGTTQSGAAAWGLKNDVEKGLY